MNAPRAWEPNRYRFTCVWDVPAPPDAVYTALSRPERYPDWWPEVREVRRLDGSSGLLRIRSLLPVELVVLAREARQDPAAGVLEAVLSGDLAGRSRWTVLTRGDGASVAVHQQEVVVRHPVMRRLAVPGRPVFRLNHALMMRRGRAGLRAYLGR